MKRLDHILTRIARKHLGITTLATRRGDSLDFHDVPVWCVLDALRAAYEAGAVHSRTPSIGDDPGRPERFDDYEIHGVREFDDGKGKYCEQVSDEDAQFWSLYGHIPGQGVDCIGDFKTREHAEEVFARITGRRYTETSICGRRKA